MSGLIYRVIEGDACSFVEFALRCARVMGSCIAQRDEDGAAPPRLPDPKRVERLRACVDQSEAMLRDARATTDERAREEIAKHHARLVAQNEAFAQSRARERGRLQAMLAQVREWTPPTPDHLNLKELMVSRLQEELDDSAGPDQVVLPSGDPAAWRGSQVATCEDHLTYAKRDLARAEENFARHTAWVTALYKSLGVDDPAAFVAAWETRQAALRAAAEEL